MILRSISRKRTLARQIRLVLGRSFNVGHQSESGMPTDPTILDVSLTIFKWLGATSLVGVLGLFSAWLAFPPELVIEGVVDKSKVFNSESKMKIKNTGRLPAL